MDHVQQKTISKYEHFILGAMQTLPIVVGYSTIGTPFGILAAQSGMPIWTITFMAFIVYACSAQCLALTLMIAHVHPIAIFLTTLLVNFRHFLMGMSLGTALPRTHLFALAIIGLGNTDETYSLNMHKFKQQKYLNTSNVLGTNIIAHVTFVLTVTIGALIGDTFTWDLRYLAGAMPIMFITLLILQTNKALDFFLILLAFIFTGTLMCFLPGKWPFLLSALTIPTIATLWIIRKEKQPVQDPV